MWIVALIIELLTWLPFLAGWCPECGGRLQPFSKPNPNKLNRCVLCEKVWRKEGKTWRIIEKTL
jgi:hypothetical protein